MPGLKSRKITTIEFEQFYASLLLQRVIHGRNAMGLTEHRWRVIWAGLTPSAREILYLVLGVGLSYDQAGSDLGCTRNNISLVMVQATKSMRKLVTFEHVE